MKSEILFLVGLSYMIAGIHAIITRNRPSKRITLFQYFWEEHEKAAKIFRIVFGILVIIFGVNLALKGIFDPSRTNFWVRF